MTTHRIYYDGTVHVQHHMCATCIGRPGNLMHLEPGRRDGMVADVLRDESCIPCHKTLGLPAQAVCRWQFDQHPTQPLQRNPKHDRAEAIAAAVRAGWHELDDGTPICAACWRAYRRALEQEAAKAQPRTQMDTLARVACPECWRAVAPDAADAVRDDQGLWLHGVCLTRRAVQS